MQKFFILFIYIEIILIINNKIQTLFYIYHILKQVPKVLNVFFFLK